MSTGVPTRGAPAASPALGSGKARALGAAGAALSQAAPAAGLILALAAAFLMGLIPKRDYLYLLHVDEWAHFDGALAVLEPGNLGFSQGGFHLLLAQLQYVTGLDWFVLFRWLPPVFFATTVFLAYIVGRRFRCGLESAFLATLVPTSIRFLGPAFLVPIGLGMMALPLLLFLLHSPAFGVRHAFLCALTLIFVGAAHPTSALLLALVILIHAVSMAALNNEVSFWLRLWRGCLMLLAIAGPALLMYAWHPTVVEWVLRKFVEAGQPTGLAPARDAASKFGWLAIGLSGLGILLLVLREGWRGYAMVASVLALLVVITLYKSTLLGYQSLADRSWLLLLLLLGVIGGYGVSSLRRWLQANLGRLGRREVAWLGGLAASLALVGASLTIGIQSRLREPYYRLMSAETASDFLWIKDHLSSRQRVAVLRTDLALAYIPLTGRGAVYSLEAWPFLNPRGREAMGFLSGGPPKDGNWWRQRGVGLIYAPQWSDNPPELDQPRPGVFIPSKLPAP